MFISCPVLGKKFHFVFSAWEKKLFSAWKKMSFRVQCLEERLLNYFLQGR